MEKFLDKGFVELIDKMGDDYKILKTARVSTGSMPKKGEDKDRGLIRYLYKQKHTSPFESVVFTFHAKLPLAMAIHLLRHRTFSFNFESSRYKEMIMDFYIPENFRKQSTKNNQGSDGNIEDDLLILGYKQNMEDAELSYKNLINKNVSRELARFVLPESIYTECYFTVNLRNLFHFLNLRLHPHTQYETREFAKTILSILEKQEDLKWSVEIFKEMTELEWEIQKLLEDKIEINEIIKRLKKPS